MHIRDVAGLQEKTLHDARTALWQCESRMILLCALARRLTIPSSFWPLHKAHNAHSRLVVVYFLSLQAGRPGGLVIPRFALFCL